MRALAAPLAVLGALAAAPVAVAPSENGLIAYLREPADPNATPSGRIWMMNPDGSGQSDRTPAGVVDVRSLAWSPNGRRLAFSAAPVSEGDPEIFVMNADGSGLRQITRNYLSDLQPTWSPDGRFLAFASARTGLFQIYRMRADGSRQQRLSNQVEDCYEPAWSPRGTAIVFWCELGFRKLVIMRPNGSRERRLTRAYGVYEHQPTWTPDGRWIVFSRGTRQSGGIHRIRPNGTGLRRLAAGSDPAVSPDGRWLLFAWNRDNQQELYRARLDGTRPVRLTATVGVEEWAPSWQPR